MKLLSQSGAVVWSATYDAFGKATVNPASTITNNLRFPGQYADAETGLHYNWMRYYDPGTGRYTTSDPIGLEGGINEYTYVEGNPISWFDPMGLSGASGSWGPPEYHYYCNTGVNCDFTLEMKDALNRFVKCLGRTVIITGGRKPRATPGSSHERGEAVDIGNKCNSNLNKNDVKRCFLESFKKGYGQEEYNDAEKKYGTHFHFQLNAIGRPGYSNYIHDYKP